MYSVALLILYTMCEEREVFYRIRNNYVENHGQQWLTSLRNDTFFELIIDMMNLKVTPKEAKDRWDNISGQVQMITEQDLWQIYGVDRWWLQVQDGMDFVPGQNLASVSLLDRLVQLSIICLRVPLSLKFDFRLPSSGSRPPPLDSPYFKTPSPGVGTFDSILTLKLQLNSYFWYGASSWLIFDH